MEPLPVELFHKYQRLIYDQSGIRLDERKSSLLASRLRRRIAITGHADAAEYFAWVTSRRGRDEVIHLLDVVTTNETSFYRTQKHFDWFQDAFLGEVARRPAARDGKRNVKVWSAACSVGAEAYTLAFCFSQSANRAKINKLQILASDLSTDSLAQAELGIYKERLITGMSDQLRERFFTKSDETPPRYTVRNRYRDYVTFRSHNLMHPSTDGPFDCIFLRNVLIYFDKASKQKVLQNMLQATKPGGYLVVGPSEGIYDLGHDFEKVETFLYRRSMQ